MHFNHLSKIGTGLQAGKFELAALSERLLLRAGVAVRDEKNVGAFCVHQAAYDATYAMRVMHKQGEIRRRRASCIIPECLR